MSVQASRVIALIALAAAPFAASSAQQRQQTPPLLIESVSGRENFERYCASCHGVDGRGGGPVASALKARPADLTLLSRKNAGVFPRERVESLVTGVGRDADAHGTAEMPVWGPIFRTLDPSDIRAKGRIANVVAYIETLQARRSDR